ncbi:hypothetical protein F441_17632 [Phytophthora nicotianae CJ01A1]|uniref:Uncharacterized protein n=2 Tax=Phytophthora nicotianae TaxID=4792 RepID=V9ECQ5_PHYNI|nr:hypothetical protein F443_17754 [Phytophthora nicotianae P1569]ETP05864.1 hypothetical protein F441_17632 [Phytophthora nicotianae CJ01A1]
MNTDEEEQEPVRSELSIKSVQFCLKRKPTYEAAIVFRGSDFISLAAHRRSEPI